MAKPVTTLAVFFVAMSLFTGTLQAQGVFSAIGLGPQVQDCPDDPTDEQLRHIADCQTERVTSDSELSTGTSTGGTLFGSYNVLLGQLGGIYDVIYPGLTLLEVAGVPGWITEGILGNLMSLLILLASISFFRGYDL